jgi:hypothetical protein
MAMMHAWAGDNAGDVVGREPNQLLIALTDMPLYSWLFSTTDYDGVPMYAYVRVTCLTPGARRAFATQVRNVGANSVLSIEPAQIDWVRVEIRGNQVCTYLRSRSR